MATRDLSPGRNDPCHCGSGAKYKRCCADADREAAREASSRSPLDVTDPAAVSKKSLRKSLRKKGRTPQTKPMPLEYRGEVDRPGSLRRSAEGNAVLSARMGRPVVRLGEDGELGYCMLRRDDCFRAALATALQVPVDQCPDPQVDKRLAAGGDPDDIAREMWVRLAEWLAGRGLQLVLHETVPAPRARWVGICPAPKGPIDNQGYELSGNPFVDHCLVMSYDRIIFDPSISIKVPRGMQIRRWHPSNVALGISFDPIKE